MLCALKAAEERPVARPQWTEVLGWPTHTPLALDHSAELEWKFVNSLLACWTDHSSWVALQLLLPFAPGPGKVLGRGGRARVGPC